MSAHNEIEGVTADPLKGSAIQTCSICSKTISNAMFAPYCSLKCAKVGTSRRYELLRCFLDFEAKYITPPKKVDVVVTMADSSETKSSVVPKEQKKPKKWK